MADADRAAALAGSDDLKFEAIKASAAAITISMSKAASANTPQNLDKAIEQFGKADDLAQTLYGDTLEPESWQWREAYVQLILRKVNESLDLGTPEKRALLEAATRSIQTASKNAPTRRQALLRLQTQVDKQKAALKP
jgi:hypothetical protein